MRILWFTWKDRSHPEAGGAENLNEILAREMVNNGNEVIFLVAGYKDALKNETRHGFQIIRTGNRYTVYLTAAWYYLTHLQSWPDLIIEEINTIPFMTQWYTRQKQILLIYQLCRQIWFYQMWFPLNLIGYVLEPLYLWLLRDNTVLTESESTKKDLQRFGFRKNRITVFPVVVEQKKPIQSQEKYQHPTLLSFGSIRPMKRTIDQVKAFEIAKEKLPLLKLIVAGSATSSYGRKVTAYIKKSRFASDISYVGTVDEEKKQELMQRAHLIMVTSTKEGWGLIVTEAGQQGTPAIVYNVDGLRDAVVDNKTGIISKKCTPHALAQEIMPLLSSKNPPDNDKHFTPNSTYLRMCEQTQQHNSSFTLQKSYAILSKLLMR